MKDRKVLRMGKVLSAVSGVSIGDVFRTGKHTKAAVIDILEKRSIVSGEVFGYICIAKSTGVASNTFETPFSTVVRNIEG